MDENLPYYLGFSYFSGIGPIKFDILLAHFGDVKQAFEASQSELTQALGPALSHKFASFRSTYDFECEYKKIVDKHISVLTREDTQYPFQILNLSDPPICLYVKGDLKNFDLSSRSDDFYFAIVGTRKPTEYGKQVASKFARELAEAGAIIVSGMAMGIDALAHWGALESGHRTIAFLGCGVNIIYPWANRDLYFKIIDSGSLIISEFPPDKITIKGHFVARNRLISGLSRGVLVAEGLKDSGSLITARYALQQGKDVFAPPAPITSDQSQAPNLLLKEGAKLVTTVEDILEEYGLKEQKTVKETLKSLPEEQKRLFQLLSQEAFTPDEIARLIKAPVYQVLSLLSTMELSGIIEKNEAGKYQIKI
ncbi:MAG: protecting protein DprA protein [Candidatus Roizmanbacteria bacterium GW2011_GWA2_37_7]|uniref:Protecting protein DprA protein n=1 Tax=Candidatus Roizmanbacteria bacterium GW2011_GWA2_37_7 TaxID=1618481 RepID=A0A0G0JHJ5_9BACT|nr:MAG: protecting protein DprA protein [Candidatus Roizmanbacteria bacterium GW2011_GWA2_37_7]